MKLEERNLTFSAGLNTSQNAASISDDEVTEAIGVEYNIGSPHLYPQPGRSLAATLPGASQVVRAIQQLQFDSVDSVLAAYGGDGALYESNVSLTPSFSSSGLAVTGSAVPQFNSYGDQWLMCNGVDPNQLREPVAPSPNTGYSGKWRRHGLQPAIGTTQITAVTSSVGTWTTTRTWSAGAEGTSVRYSNEALAYDSTTNPAFLDTYAEGYVYGGSGFNEAKATRWSFTTSETVSLSNKVVQVVHSGYTSAPHQFGPVGGHAIEVSFNSGTSWTRIFGGNDTYDQTTSTIAVPATVTNLNTIRVRAIAVVFNDVSGQNFSGRVHDIQLLDTTNTNAGTSTTTNAITYLVTERFVDGNGVVHESQGTTFSVPQTLSAAVAVKVYLPGIASDGTGTVTRANPVTTDFVIYRSIDEAGGGYPFMWEIGSVKFADTNGGTGSTTYFQDTFALSLTTDDDKTHLYDVTAALFPDGSTIYAPTNAPPPLSTMSLVYQGAVVYWPAGTPSRLFYSVPASISTRAAEQVPFFYYLDFQTPSADTAVSGTLCNGGRSLIVYFPAYTMLVNYLPQAGDPGVFDTRVKEYVSQVRGAAGRFCSASISLPSGGQLAVAADAMGVWATDGVSGIQDWTKDINWTSTDRDGLMDGVDLSTAQMRDNPPMRRLELLYTDTDGRKKELHFFYGDFKQNGLPKITGNHYAGDGSATTGGWISSHYSFADTSPRQWLGWKGSGYTDGKVYLERLNTDGTACYSDASHAYDNLGNVPHIATSGDQYMAGLGQSATVETATPKFMPGVQKDMTVIGTFYRDGNAVTVTKTKTYATNERSGIYWHVYGDRHRVSIQDISTTQGTALVAYKVHYRPLGPSKDQAPTT